MAKILLCDPDESLRRSLGRILQSGGHEVEATDGPGCKVRIGEERHDLIITEIRMPGVDGFEIIAAAHRNAPRTPVVAMGGNPQFADAVNAMRAGANDFLVKPIELAALEEVLARLLRTGPPAPDNMDPLEWRARHAPWLLGADPAMLPVFEMIAGVAFTSCTVLISGEPGTGKELAARALHAGSGRADRPFVPVNVAAVPAHLVESELFGHSRREHTGLMTLSPGRFAQAAGGTIFLDEVGQLDLAVQAKLLRVLQEGEIHPVGERRPRKIDVRFLAATSRNLEQEVEEGRFRADLFWRLNVIPIDMPSLRARSTDIVPLAEFFIGRANRAHGQQVAGIDPQAGELMRRYSWPGNVHELDDVISRMVIDKGTGMLTPEDLPPSFRVPSSPSQTPIPTPPREGLRVFLCHGKEDKVATRHLYIWLKDHGFEPWFDEESLLPGDDWREEISRAIRASDIVLVCLSKTSTSKTGFVQNEIRIALDALESRPQGTIYVIPAKLEEVAVPERISRWQCVDLQSEQGYQRLKIALIDRANGLGRIVRV